jgi:thiosulfate reductase cytochrome b subunit
VSRPVDVRTLRRLILWLLIVGLVGLSTDLVALAHYEDPWQVAPLVVIGLALLTVVWHFADGSLASVRALQVAMMFLLITGGIGFVLHYQSNREFQLEMDATLSSWAVFKKAIRAHAPPALAPLSMGLIGLIGLVYTFRYEEQTQ